MKLKKSITKIFIPVILIAGAGLLMISFLPLPDESRESLLSQPARPSLCISASGKEIVRALDTTRQMAPLLKGLGNYKMEAMSESPEAKIFFDQGLTLYYGFNHLEAFRSFKEAARLDPDFAMAYWGQAMCLGPNINAAMDPADGKTVYEAVVKAQSLADRVSEKEKLLIGAVAKRYTEEAPVDRSHLDQAYADAMKIAAEKFQTDPDVISLYAEALMDLHPWDYWLKDGKPQPWTSEITSVIEKAISLFPKHPGANHLYIHAIEASGSPGKAMASADLLRDLVPAAGHLVHMPSHIYIRTGRYEDGVVTNQNAIKTDEEYLAQCKASGFYPLILYPHNIHFLWACATLDGQSAQAIKAADLLAAKQNFDLMLTPALSYLQHFYATPYYARVRFGKWDEIIRLEKPDARLKYTNAIFRYARTIAYIRKNKPDQATAEFIALKKIMDDSLLVNEKVLGINSTTHVLQIAVLVTEGELAASQKNYTKAVEKLKEAMKLEDALIYQEPYDWHHPVRQVLGDVLLEAGDAQQAEKYFREDLQLFANNGWALTGLKVALENQGKHKDAKEIEKQINKSFTRADIRLKDARF
jgi:tetratricopeptide (TPR) repeat protein